MKLGCLETVWDSAGWRRYPCARTAKVDGYCTQHHPDNVAKRKAKRAARWNREMAAHDLRHATHALGADAIAWQEGSLSSAGFSEKILKVIAIRKAQDDHG